jgi:hypothetical protein
MIYPAHVRKSNTSLFSKGFAFITMDCPAGQKISAKSSMSCASGLCLRSVLSTASYLETASLMAALDIILKMIVENYEWTKFFKKTWVPLFTIIPPCLPGIYLEIELGK